MLSAWLAKQSDDVCLEGWGSYTAAGETRDQVREATPTLSH